MRGILSAEQALPGTRVLTLEFVNGHKGTLEVTLKLSLCGDNDLLCLRLSNVSCREVSKVIFGLGFVHS